jgi:hypothetical protein
MEPEVSLPYSQVPATCPRGYTVYFKCLKVSIPNIATNLVITVVMFLTHA